MSNCCQLFFLSVCIEVHAQLATLGHLSEMLVLLMKILFFFELAFTLLLITIIRRILLPIHESQRNWAQPVLQPTVLPFQWYIQFCCCSSWTTNLGPKRQSWKALCNDRISSRIFHPLGNRPAAAGHDAASPTIYFNTSELVSLAFRSLVCLPHFFFFFPKPARGSQVWAAEPLATPLS